MKIRELSQEYYIRTIKQMYSKQRKLMRSYEVSYTDDVKMDW